MAVEIPVEGEIPVPVDEYVLVAIVVEVAPDAPHRHAIARSIQIREPSARRHVLEGAVVSVSIQRVRLTDMTVREIEIRPTIAVEVGHSDGGTDGCDVRLDVVDLWIEARTMVDEVNSRRGRRIVQHEAGMHWVRRGADRPMIQPHREQDRAEEWHGDDGSASEGRGTAHAGCGTRV